MNFRLYRYDTEIEVYSGLSLGKVSISTNDIFKIQPFSISFNIPMQQKQFSKQDIIRLDLDDRTIFKGIISEISKDYQKKEVRIVCQDFFKALKDTKLTIQTYTSEETYDINNNIAINDLILSVNNFLPNEYNLEVLLLNDTTTDLQGNYSQSKTQDIRKVDTFKSVSISFVGISNSIASWKVTQETSGGDVVTLVNIHLIKGADYSNITTEQRIVIGYGDERILLANVSITYDFEVTTNIKNIGCNYKEVSIMNILQDIAKITNRRLTLDLNKYLRKQRIELKKIYDTTKQNIEIEYIGKKENDYVFNPNFQLPTNIKVNYEDIILEDTTEFINNFYEHLKEDYKQRYTKKVTTQTTNLNLSLNDMVDDYLVNSINYKNLSKGILGLELLGR